MPSGTFVLVDTTTIQAAISSLTASEVLTVNQSFTKGSAAIYDQLSTDQATSTGFLAACSSCHVSLSPAFYKTTAAATFTAMGTLGIRNLDLHGLYDAACVHNPGGGMPDYSATPICHLLLDWLTQGGAQN